MTKEKNTTTKTAEPMSIKTVVNPVADKPKKTNTHGIQNLNISRKKESKPAMYQLMKNGGKDSRGKIIYPVVYMVKAEDIIYDPEKDINRKIRYIPGEVSIFEDEQKDDAKVKSPITFSNGFLMVDKTNPTLRKYLDMCNANYSNPNRSKNSAAAFKLLNSEEKAKKNIDKMMVELDAVRSALEMPLEKLIGYAKVLGINVNKSTDEIRYDMKMLAQKDPHGFMGGMNDPKTELKEILLKANEYRIISLSKSSVSWVKGDQRPVITHVPLGIKAIDHMAEYCMSGKGESVLEHIKLQLERLEG
tara:strand:- start:562 stop:1470 length:909 start_codon:yes stop_codon:yes gene_type:complete